MKCSQRQYLGYKFYCQFKLSLQENFSAKLILSTINCKLNRFFIEKLLLFSFVYTLWNLWFLVWYNNETIIVHKSAENIFKQYFFWKKMCNIESTAKITSNFKRRYKTTNSKHRMGKLYILLINISTYLGRLLVIRKFRWAYTGRNRHPHTFTVYRTMNKLYSGLLLVKWRA